METIPVPLDPEEPRPMLKPPPGELGLLRPLFPKPELPIGLEPFAAGVPIMPVFPPPATICSMMGS